MTAGWSFETRQIHAGARPDPATGARATPIYQSSSFSFHDAQHAADAFALRDLETHAYTRLSNRPPWSSRNAWPTWKAGWPLSRSPAGRPRPPWRC
jgi:O-acetylhomoserine/O-acetylserine sulfhydrylase-like pyridoxal-dependent enzyme